ncbi:sorbosone dehydrogenase family protein [soil metagenome]
MYPQNYTFILPFCLLLICSVTVLAQNDKEPREAKMEVAVFKPYKQEATEENVKKLKVPDGFKIEKFAEDLGNARMITVHNNGDVYVTARDEGKVFLLRDTNGDGKADHKSVVSELEDVHGIGINQNTMYLVTIKDLYATSINEDGTLGQLQKLVDDLPDGGQHPNRTIGFGPDNMLYMSIGSTCNACEEPNPEHATLLRFNPDGSGRKIFAHGLRNTTGFAFHPATNEFWGMDHNTDWLGDDESHEELNKIEEDAHYGWPFVYDDGKKMPHREPEEMEHEDFIEQTKFPVLMYQPHSSAMSFAFNTGDHFPEEYKLDAFVTMRGSWNRENPTGYKVVRLKFNDDNQPEEFEDFVTGFLLEDGRSHYGRLTGLTFHTDGSLLFTDDSNGVVYRVSYEGNN